MIKTIAEIIRHKGKEVWTIDVEATVYQALELMAEKEVGALVVTGADGIVGILSERDYARKVILKGLSSPNTPVQSIMTTRVRYATPKLSVEEGLALMTETHCRHLPVMENNQMIGLISIGDLVKASISEKEFMINQLENYIKGG